MASPNCGLRAEYRSAITAASLTPSTAAEAISTRPVVSPPTVAPNLAAALGIGLEYSPSGETSASAFSRLSRGTLKLRNQIWPLSTPLRPALDP